VAGARNMEIKKIYTIRKYVVAKNLKEAMKKEPKSPIDDI
jgi:hypothetical protein